VTGVGGQATLHRDPCAIPLAGALREDSIVARSVARDASANLGVCLPLRVGFNGCSALT